MLNKLHKCGNSRNVRGLNSLMKRGKLYAHLRSLKADICCLQETHIKKTAAKVIRPSWESQVHQSNFSIEARGAAIIILRNIPFIHKKNPLQIRGADV